MSETTLIYVCPEEGVMMDTGWSECPICGHTFSDDDMRTAVLYKNPQGVVDAS